MVDELTEIGLRREVANRAGTTLVPAFRVPVGGFKQIGSRDQSDAGRGAEGDGRGTDRIIGKIRHAGKVDGISGAGK
jgi:hypothetical protein